MIEALMFYALGLLSAGIVALVLGPPLWRRAVRLARLAIERTLPMSHAEIQAEKDQIRAGYAVSSRRLEAKIESLEAEVAEQWVDITRKREVITHLTAEGSLSAEDIIALEARRNELEHILIDRELEIGGLNMAAMNAQANESALKLRLAQAQETIETMSAERQEQRMEIIARDTELDNLRDAVAAEKTEATTSEVQRAGLASELSEFRANAAIDRRRAEEAALQQAETERLRLAAIATLAAKDEASAAARMELAAARTQIDALSLRLVEAEAAGMSTFAAKESLAELETRFADLEKDNAKLNAELVALRKAEADTRLSEPETALLRGKLIELGAAVARLSSEAPGPSVVPSLTDESEDASRDSAAPEALPAEGKPVNLAERIRALQHAGGGF